MGLTLLSRGTIFVTFVLCSLLSAAQFGLPDEDKDGIADIYELYGFEYEGSRIDFPGLGADPYKKDIFTEIDVMEGITIPPGAFENVKKAFRNAPIINPNGTKGINLHISGRRTVPFYSELDFISEITPQGNRKNGQVAVDNNGRTVIVWQDDKDANDIYQVHANIFDANGNQLLSSEITINRIADGQQVSPDVAISDAGHIVVVWQDDQDGNGLYEILARIFDRNGSPLGNEIEVNQVSEGQQTNPVVGIDKNNNFLVVWLDDRDENGYHEIMARSFNANGTPVSSEITINQVGDGEQRNINVAINGDGNAVVVWEDDRDGNGYFEIFARKINAAGSFSGNEIHVNKIGDGQQLSPAVAIDNNGNFVVAWADDSNGNGLYEVYARRFQNGGTADPPQIRVNQVGDGQQKNPAVAIITTGAFVVAWEDDLDGNGYYEILMRRFGSNGNPLSGSIPVNNFSEGQQRYPELSSSANGRIYFCFADSKVADLWSVRFRSLNSTSNIFSGEKPSHTDVRSFQSVKDYYFTPVNRFHFHYCIIAASRFQTSSSGIANVGGQNLIVSLGIAPGLQRLDNTFMHELGHNLGLQHGGDADINDKPNYLSVMNYLYQMGGADNNCDASSISSSPEELTYSRGWNKDLNENSLNEGTGICEGEKHVNWMSSGQQYRPVADMNASGRYAVAWQDDFDGNGFYEIYCKTYGDNGVPVSYEKRMNRVSAGHQRNPSVGIAGNGNIVVVWDDDRDGNGSYQVYAQRCQPDGDKTGPEILVNSASAGNQVRPDISVADNGNFGIVWQDDRNSDGSYETYYRFFSAAGLALTGNIKVSENSNTDETRPRIAMNNSNRSVIVWEDDRDGNGFNEIYARCFNDDFTKRGNEFAVNDIGDGQQATPDVGIAGNGSFVIVWEDDNDENGFYQVLAKRYDGNRVALGGQFTVNREGSGQQRYPRVEVNNNFGFSVCWQDDQDDNGLYQVFLRNFNESGNPVFDHRTANLVAAGQQVLPVVALGDNGNTCVVWQDDRDGNQFYEIVSTAFTFNGNLLHRIPIDWNRNGTINSGTVSVDINDDGNKTVLKDFNDWGSIKLIFY